MIENINRRLEELRKSLTSLQNNANAHIGAIQELERLKKEIEEEQAKKEETVK